MNNIKDKFFPFDELLELYSKYLNSNKFVEKYSHIDYIQFDYYVVNDLSLFTNIPEMDFNSFENQVDKIIKLIPAIKRIFTKPLLHLKDNDIVMPVEAVRIIDRKSIEHIFRHSEFWENIVDDNIKPLKLQTKIYEDTYGIYENLKFCDAIDIILRFTKRSLRFLKELILTKQTIDLNLLDRVNHMYYFLALGKLHTGYMRFFDRHSDVVQRTYAKLKYLNIEISNGLRRPVYKKNKKRNKNLRLHRTNIFSMHKDYRQIYFLLKSFNKNKYATLNTNHVDMVELRTAYYNYCQILFIFAIGHFNFELNSSRRIDFKSLDVNFHFKKWKLNMTTINEQKIIQMNINNEGMYKIVFIPVIEQMEDRELYIEQEIIKAKQLVSADEYIVCNPYEFDWYFKDERSISIANIESFRRIQQLILKGMVLTDHKREECPFCNSKLIINDEISKLGNIAYTCSSCRTTIVDTVCPKEQKKYSYTKIFGLEYTRLIKEDYDKYDEWLYYRKIESQMFYRNITDIDNQGGILCPYCHKVHQESIV